MKVSADLHSVLLEKLDEYCEGHDTSRELALVRAVVQLVYADVPEIREPRVSDLYAAFGMWRDRGISTDEYMKRIRAEWDRDSVWDDSIGAYVSPNDE